MSAFPLPKFTPVTDRDQLSPDITQFMPEGMALVTTPEMQATLLRAPIALRSRRLVVIEGEPGCGKSLLKGVLAAACPVRAVMFSVPAAKGGGKTFVQVAHEALLGGEPPRRYTQREHENALRRLLTEQPTILLIDEVQNAPIEVLRNLRNMIEAPGTKFAMVLLGTNVTARLRSEPMLTSWIGATTILRPLMTPTQAAATSAAQRARRAQLLPTLAAMHPRLAATDTDVLLTFDRAHCRGHIRPWVVVLEWLLAFNPESDSPFTLADFEMAVESVTGEYTAIPA